MVILKAFRHPALFRLWIGQAFSSIGDEIYRVALIWLAVGIIGADAGYLAASQAASLMLLNFIGGKWADNWDPLKTMIRIDFIRALIVMIPVAWSYYHPVPLPVLWTVAVVIAGLGAFFDPALQATLPKYSPDTATLRSATGLMSTTIRMARMVGPSIIGLLSALVPMIHFFTIDAVTFLISAFSLRALGKASLEEEEPLKSTKRSSLISAITSGFQAVKEKEGFGYVMFSKAITGGTWNLALTLGFALLVHDLLPGDTRAFGLAIASYGVGNFAGALYFGNHPRPHSEFLMYWGYVWLGTAFVAMGFAPSLTWIMLAAAVGGFGGPMNDLSFVDLVQKRFQIREIAKIFRLRGALETAVTLITMLLAPMLFKLLGAAHVIAICGAIWIACGLYGVYIMRKSNNGEGI